MNRPLLLTTAAVLLVLGGVTTALTVGHDADTNGGSGEPVPAVCGTISAAALARARTTSPNDLGSYTATTMNDTRTTCSWVQAEGPGRRTTDISVEPGRGSGIGETVRQHLANAPDMPQQKPLEGLGDEAVVLRAERGTPELRSTEIAIVVRKGRDLVVVRHSGWDDGGRPDVTELEAAAKGIAAELVAKL